MKIIDIYHEDLLNGTGLREVLYFSGCEWNCKGCFQSWTADPNCEQARDWTEEDYKNLSNKLKNQYISGVTLSGGDPLSFWNESDVLELVKKLKTDFPEKTIWCYTGYTWENLIKLSEDNSKRQILDYIDVLCDGPFIESLKSPEKPWVGSENQRVIDVKESLKQEKIILYK